MAAQPSSHRLPSISAIEALQGSDSRGPRVVSSGLAQLDKLLAPPTLPGRTAHGGLLRGKVTEVYGPPGTGKTALGLQAAAQALWAGHSVVWVEAGTPLVPQRLRRVLAATQPADAPSSTPTGRFYHRRASTLAHWLALFVHPPPTFPPSGTVLIVIDSPAPLLDVAYPRNVDRRPSRGSSEHAKWAAGRRAAVVSDLSAALTRTAALHDVALLVACQASTRIQPGTRALLVPAISGATWESGISTRLVLFRDWASTQETTHVDAPGWNKARFVGLAKVNGTNLADVGGVGNVVPFAVEETGLCDINFAAVEIASPVLLPEVRPPKRRFTEVGDSEEELDSDEYGWAEDDTVTAEGLLVDDDACTPDPDTAAVTAAPSKRHRPGNTSDRRSPETKGES